MVGGQARFLKSGGKLIMYQGYSDGRVSPFSTIRFYEDAAWLSGGLKQLQRSPSPFRVYVKWRASPID
jgi:hypothetical protein